MCPKQETTIFNIPLLEWHYYIITQPWTVYYVIISKKTISSILLDIWYQDIHCASACVYIFFTPSSHHTNLLKHLTLFSTLLGILHTFTIVTSIATVEKKTTNLPPECQNTSILLLSCKLCVYICMCLRVRQQSWNHIVQIQ